MSTSATLSRATISDALRSTGYRPSEGLSTVLFLATAMKRPLLLATRYTMEQDFYLSQLRAKYGIAAMVPDAEDRTSVHDIIFGELCRGIVLEQSRQRYLEVIDKARAAGADGVILGCTEIGLLIGPDHVGLPTFDSTLLHADSAVDFALAQSDAPRRNAA